MYKDGKHWTYAYGLLPFLVGGAVALLTQVGPVSADSTVNVKANSSATTSTGAISLDSASQVLLSSASASPSDSSNQATSSSDVAASSLAADSTAALSSSDTATSVSATDSSMASSNSSASSDSSVSNSVATSLTSASSIKHMAMLAATPVNQTVSVNSWDEMKAAIAAAPTDGSLYTIEVDGVIDSFDGSNWVTFFDVPAGSNILLTAGTPDAELADGSRMGFVLYDNATLTINDLTIDQTGGQSGLYYGTFSAVGDTNNTTVNLTGSTKIIGNGNLPLFGQGQAYDMTTGLPITVSTINTVNMSGDATITNFGYAYLDNESGTSTDTLNMADNAQIINSTYAAVYAYGGGGKTMDINMTGNAAMNNNASAIAGISNINLNGGYFSGNKQSVIEADGSANLTVTGATFENNQNTSSAPILLQISGGSASITNSTFINNSGNSAGAIIMQGSPATPLNISNSTFTGNTSTAGVGAVAINVGTNAVFDNDTFTGNVGGNSGNSAGAIYATLGSLQVSNSTFTNNSDSQNGGAININYQVYTDTSLIPVTFTNDTFDGNTASGNGGAVAISTAVTAATPGVTPVVFQADSFTNNVAGQNGGAIGFTNMGTTIANTVDDNANAYLTNVLFPATLVKTSGTTFTNNTASTLTQFASADQDLLSNLAGVTANTVTPVAYNNYAIQYYGDQLTAIPVTFNSNGGSTIDGVTSYLGGLIQQTVVPTKAGYTFVGWYSDSALTQPWSLATSTIPSDFAGASFALYAKWAPVSTGGSEENPTITSPAQGGGSNANNVAGTSMTNHLPALSQTSGLANNKIQGALPETAEQAGITEILGLISLMSAITLYRRK
ncbi:internalin A [Weissella oryzae SG25]|uniref:Internalin A n=2 Tax=Weissella TaxID=46255 RepID=A0A069CV40_WEIOS|nr:internalin A [Weissella oryzae SG25]